MQKHVQASFGLRQVLPSCGISKTHTDGCCFPSGNSSEGTTIRIYPAALQRSLRLGVAYLATTLSSLQWALQMKKQLIGGYNKVFLPERQLIGAYNGQFKWSSSSSEATIRCFFSSNSPTEATMSSSNGAAPHCRLFWLVALRTSYLRRLQWALHFVRHSIVRVFDVSHSELLHFVGYRVLSQMKRIVNSTFFDMLHLIQFSIRRKIIVFSANHDISANHGLK